MKYTINHVVEAQTFNRYVLIVVMLGVSTVLGATVNHYLSSPGVNAAPAPNKVKPVDIWGPIAKPANPHVGTWVMTWRGSEYRNTKFNADGTYSTERSNLKGAWKIEQNGRQLRVHEYTTSGNFYNWTVDLREDGISGILIEDMSEFKLVPQTSPLDVDRVNVMPRTMSRVD